MQRPGKQGSYTDLVQITGTLPWLSKDAAAELLQDGRIVRLRPREILLRENRPADRVFILINGAAKLYYSQRKRRVLAALLGPGDFVGLSVLWGGGRSEFGCEAATSCLLLACIPERFCQVAFGSSLGRLRRPLEGTFGSCLKTASIRMRYLHLGTRARLQLILRDVADKFGIHDARGLLIPIVLTHSEIGGLAGASRQHVTSLITRFKREGTLLQEGRRLIVRQEPVRRQRGNHN